MAIMISIPAGVIANQNEANSLVSNLSGTITETGQSINQTLTQIDCTLAPDFASFGFRAPMLLILTLYRKVADLTRETTITILFLTLTNSVAALAALRGDLAAENSVVDKQTQ